MSFENQLLQFMGNPQYRPMKQHELARALHIDSKGKRVDFRHELYALESAGKVARLRKNRWALPDTDNQVVGIIKIMAKGGAIIIPENEGDEEIYISDRKTGVALPNDKVAVEVFHSEFAARSGSETLRSEGRVMRVIERANTHAVGLLRHTPYYAYVIPDAPGFKHEIHVDNGKETPENYKVVVQLNDWTDPFKPLTGTITETIGSVDKPGVDVDSLLRSAGIQEEFPKDVVAEADALSDTIKDANLSERRDLREDVIFTIDPETAKDYDDAVSIEPHPDGGWNLGVHIADVSHFVKPGTKLDEEAFKRGNSIYLVDRCVMMLPRELTTKVCSLNPQNDHLSHTVQVHLSEEGEMLAYESFPSIIHSKQRMNYTQVQQFIDGKDDHNIPDFIIERLNNLCPLVRKIRALRVANGSVEINTPEIEIKLNKKGKVEKMMPRSESKDAYQLIEDCMLLANRAVAEILIKAEHPAMYRVHDEPDDEQWASMGMELQALGIDKLPQSRADINEAVQMATGTPVEYTANLAILRNFKRAEYSATQIGHFGLAFEDYTHFTSPIRRYPDLIVHRLLKAVEKGESLGLAKDKIDVMALHCTQTEKQADDLEKRSIETKRLEYYSEILNQSAVPEVFKGYIVSIKGKGMIVELPDSLQRGMVTFSSVTSDWLEANDTNTQAITRGGKTRFKIGDEVEVCLAKVDTARCFLDFVLAGQVSAPAPRRRKPKIQPDFNTGKPRRSGKRRRR